MSESIKNLAQALAKAQAEIKAPTKNKHVDFTHNGKRTKYSYADLADVIDCVRDPLSKNQLSLIHQLVYDGERYGLKTSLMHSSGESIDTWYPLPDPAKQQIRAQEFGSALTYARRYSLSSLIGIASEDDDDGQTAAPTPQPEPKKVAPKTLPPQSYPQDPQEFQNELEAALTNDAPKSQLDELYELSDLYGITNAKAKEIIKEVTGKAKKSTELSAGEIAAVMSYIKLVASK
jgi:hypothetical protein